MIANDKGHILFHQMYENSDAVPLIGKHSKSIISGAWNLNNEIALASEDRTITLSNNVGDTIYQTSLPKDASNIQVIIGSF